MHEMQGSITLVKI